MEEDSRLSTLTIQQEKILSWVGILPALLSILGSSTIIFKNIRNRASTGPYDRLLVALSICDTIASLAYMLSPFLVPTSGFSESPRVYAIGSPGSCSLLGWLTQFGFAAVVYNGALSYYYLLTVRFGISREDFATKYEKWIHGIILLFFFSTSTMGAFIGLFNELELGFGCWINDFPEGCEEEDCTSYLFGWGLGAIPTLLTLISIIVNNIVIFFYVRRQFRASSSSEISNQTQLERSLRQATQLREVATQGFLYVAFFFLSYTGGFVMRVLESQYYNQQDEANLFVLMLLTYFFLPLQGFFNMLVYNRPSYIRVRAANPDRNRFWAAQYVCFNSSIPKLSEVTLSNGSLLLSRKSGTAKRVIKYSSELPP